MRTDRGDGLIAHLERVRLSKRDFPTAIPECVETVSLDTPERDEPTVPETEKDTANYGRKTFYPSNQNSSKKIFMTDTQFVCQIQISGHTERLSLRGIACSVGYFLPRGSVKCQWQDPPSRELKWIISYPHPSLVSYLPSVRLQSRPRSHLHGRVSSNRRTWNRFTRTLEIWLPG